MALTIECVQKWHIKKKQQLSGLYFTFDWQSCQPEEDALPHHSEKDHFRLIQIERNTFPQRLSKNPRTLYREAICSK